MGSATVSTQWQRIAQRDREMSMTEEPYALVGLVRVCGGPARQRAGLPGSSLAIPIPIPIVPSAEYSVTRTHPKRPVALRYPPKETRQVDFALFFYLAVCFLQRDGGEKTTIEIAIASSPAVAISISNSTTGRRHHPSPASISEPSHKIATPVSDPAGAFLILWFAMFLQEVSS